MAYADRLSPHSIKMIEDETLEFIKTNLNHLPMYYIPANEFPWTRIKHIESYDVIKKGKHW